MPLPIHFPGYVPNSVAIQQLWAKTDFKGVGQVVHLKSDSFEILEYEMDTMWLPWGTSKKKEKAWLKQALGLKGNLVRDDVIHSKSNLQQQKISETIVPEGLHKKESDKEREKEKMMPQLYAQLEEFVTSSAVPETWDSASVYATDKGPEPVPEFVVSLLNQQWFQKYFPDFKPEEVDSERLPKEERDKKPEKERDKTQLLYEAYPECFTVEGVATILLKTLKQSSYEDGPQIMMMLIDMMPHLGIDFRKKLQNMLLKLLNKEPPPNLVDKTEKKFVMTALQVLMIASLGSKDVVLELMSYFLYSPPRCRPMVKKLLEQLGLKDPHNFLYKEMVTWAEGKNLTSKAALRGRCGQKLEVMITNLKGHLKQNLLLPTSEDKEISVSPREHPSPGSLSRVSPATKTEKPHLKFPQPPTPAPSANYRAISQFIPKQPRESSPKQSPKPTSKLSPSLYPDLPTTTPTSPSPHSGSSPSETVLRPKSSMPSKSRAVSLPSLRFPSFRQTPLLRRAISEPYCGQLLENPYMNFSAPASTASGWVRFLGNESRTAESSMSAPPSPQETEIEITPIDALNFFCELQFQVRNERIKTQKARRGITLSTHQFTRRRKILRLRERGDFLTALDAAGVTNFQRARYRMGTISHSVKLPLPRVEPIPFPPAWPPPSRPLPPLILEDSLQRYFLPKLARSENYH